MPNSKYRRLETRVAIFVAAVCFSFSSPAHDAPFSRRITVHWTALSQERFDQSLVEEIKINSPSAVQQFGQLNIPINEHFFDFEVSEAFTIKADGSRVPIASDKILLSALPDAPRLDQFQADVKVRTLVFPNVGVGDTLHYATKLRQKVAPLPGGFSTSLVFTPSARFDEVEVSLDAPAALTVHTFASGFSESVSTDDGVRRYEWKKKAEADGSEASEQTAPIDHDPRVLISSYSDDESIGASFMKGAAPKSEPTERVRTLADEITSGIADRRRQAAAIYDWITHNIRYLNIVLGAGAFEPHSADIILDLKYGDCKDHATLFVALLQAKGIAAEFALINLSPIYKDRPIPFLGFDHVIVYLPDYDVYADPTATYASFGTLMGHEADKPVLRVRKSGVEAARTPSMRAETNEVVLTVDATLRPDGSPFGSTVTTATGSSAAVLRGAVATLPADEAQQWFSRILLRQGWHGAGEIERVDPLDHSDPFVVTATWGLKDSFYGDGNPTSTLPVGPLFVQPLSAYFANIIDIDPSGNFPCPAGSFEMSIDMHMDPSQALSKTPRDVHVSSALGSYDATYELKGASFIFGSGGTLRVRRKFVARTPVQDCAPDIAEKLHGVVLAAQKDFATVVSIRH